MGVVLVPASVLEHALEPWASNTHPGDAPRRHVEEVSAGEHHYTVPQGGTMDGTELPLADGLWDRREGAIEQTWESNRAVRLENMGETDVVNPWLSNGRNNFRSLDEIVASAVEPGHDRPGEGHRALVPADPPPLPPRRATTTSWATR